MIIPPAYLEYFAPLSITDIIFTRLVHAQSHTVEEYYGHCQTLEPPANKHETKIIDSIHAVMHEDSFIWKAPSLVKEHVQLHYRD